MNNDTAVSAQTETAPVTAQAEASKPIDPEQVSNECFRRRILDAVVWLLCDSKPRISAILDVIDIARGEATNLKQAMDYLEDILPKKAKEEYSDLVDLDERTRNLDLDEVENQKAEIEELQGKIDDIKSYVESAVSELESCDFDY